MFTTLHAFANPNPQVPPAPPPPPPDKSSPAASSPQDAPLPDEGNIPEEGDSDSKEPDYRFNPLQAKKEFDVGVFYFKKHDYRGAIPRFETATKWNPGWAEAYLKLGEAQAKLKHKEDARKSFAKVVQLDPQSKEAKEAKRLTAKL